MPPEGFEPAIPGSKRAQTYALDRAPRWDRPQELGRLNNRTYFATFLSVAFNGSVDKLLSLCLQQINMS
jgi:hypothetical protein